MLEILKIIYEREKLKKTNKQRQKRKRTRKGLGRVKDRSYSEKVRAKWFCCAFKLGFLQLICKASLILVSNLGLALSSIF